MDVVMTWGATTRAYQWWELALIALATVVVAGGLGWLSARRGR